MPLPGRGERVDGSARAVALAAVYAGWAHDQRLMVGSVAPLTADQLALRAAPHQHDIGHLAAHIAAARARMIHWILGEGDDGLDALARWDGFDQPASLAIRPVAELVRGLEASAAAIQDALARWKVDDLDEVVEWRYDGDTHTYTCQRMIWNLVRHDYHYYGEIALTLGIHGLAAPDF